MQEMKLVAKIELGELDNWTRDFEMSELFKDENCRLFEVKVTQEKPMKKHRSSEPVMIVCLEGKGHFLAGENLEEKQELQQGYALMLAPNVAHEVIAEPKLHLLVTKFKKGDEEK